VGWGWADLFPYFIKAEDNDDPYMVASGYHGKGGPLPVSNQVYWERITEAFRDSGPYLNYSIGDSKGPKQSVFEIHQRNTRHGERYSAARAYLESLPERKNLRIFTDILVTKIIINDEKKVKGVEYISEKAKKVVRIRKEVILCAGAIQSPQILMMSGKYSLKIIFN
jgi:choline dehydrogenase-like flavoprotein